MGTRVRFRRIWFPGPLRRNSSLRRLSGDATLIHSDGESSVGNNDQDETGSIHQLFEDRLGGNPEQEVEEFQESVEHAAVYMAGGERITQPMYNTNGNLVQVVVGPNQGTNIPATQGPSGSVPGTATSQQFGPSPALMTTLDSLNTLLATPITAENMAQHNAEVARLKHELTRLRQEV